jgi:hypothetical protein
MPPAAVQTRPPLAPPRAETPVLVPPHVPVEAPPPVAPRDRGWVRLALVCGALSLALGGALMLWAPPGVDRAAHLFHLGQYERYGWTVWNNYWYAGRYELLNSSFLFYPIAAIIGVNATVLATVGGTSALFAVLARGIAPPRGAFWAAISFAIGWPAVVVAGQYPFALGTLFGVAALVFFPRRHLAGVAATFGALLASPLAFLLLSIVLAGLAVGARHRLRSPRLRMAAAGVLAMVAVELLLLRMFPTEGHFAYPPLDLVAILALCGFGSLFAWRQPALRGLLGAYALAGVGFFLFPSGVGGNIARLADYFALPILILAVSRDRSGPRRLVPIVLLVAATSQSMPFVRNLEGGLQERADNAAFWASAISFLQARNDPNYRVEAVATWGHWESYYLAQADIPITRGWFRQDDFPLNSPLYDGSLDIASYKTWLRSLAVKYVVLPSEELDYSSRKEAEILRAGVKPGLKLVYRDANVDILELVADAIDPSPTPLLTTAVYSGEPTVPGDRPEVQAFRPDSVALWLPAAGLYDLRIRYTPYWQTSDPDICATSDPVTGMTRIVAHHGGPVLMQFDLTLRRSTSQALGTAATCSYTSLPVVPR